MWETLNKPLRTQRSLQCYLGEVSFSTFQQCKTKQNKNRENRMKVLYIGNGSKYIILHRLRPLENIVLFGIKFTFICQMLLLSDFQSCFVAQKYKFLKRWKKSKSPFQFFKDMALQCLSLNTLPNWNCVQPKSRKCTFHPPPPPPPPKNKSPSIDAFYVFPFLQGKEPSDQHIKQVCMRVMQGETWWAFDPIYHFLCASFHGFNLSQNASLHSRVRRRPSRCLTDLAACGRLSSVKNKKGEEGPHSS